MPQCIRVARGFHLYGIEFEPLEITACSYSNRLRVILNSEGKAKLYVILAKIRSTRLLLFHFISMTVRMLKPVTALYACDMRS
jgi:hypothetical protein